MFVLLKMMIMSMLTMALEMAVVLVEMMEGFNATDIWSKEAGTEARRGERRSHS